MRRDVMIINNNSTNNNFFSNKQLTQLKKQLVALPSSNAVLYVHAAHWQDGTAIVRKTYGGLDGSSSERVSSGPRGTVGKATVAFYSSGQFSERYF